MANKSEEELGKVWDKCLADSIVKIGGGLAVGAVLSLVFFRRRVWPLTFGMATGLGMSISNCQNELKQPFYSRIQKIQVKSDLIGKSQAQ